MSKEVIKAINDVRKHIGLEPVKDIVEHRVSLEQKLRESMERQRGYGQ